MADGDVQMKFDANTAEFVSRVMAAQRAMDDASKKSREFGKDVAEAGDAAGKSFEGMGASLAGAAAGWASLSTAVGFAKEAIIAHMQEIHQAAELTTKSTQTLTGALAGSGQLINMPTLRAGMKGIGGNVLSQPDVEGTLATIMKNMGGKISADDALRATKSAVAARGAGIEDIGAFGTTVAQLGTVQGLKGLGDDQLNEAAFQINKLKPGGLSEQDMRFIKRGKDPMQALNMVLAGARSNESAKGLEAVEQAAEQDIDPVKVALLEKKKKHHHKKFTEEEDRYLRLASIPEDERHAAVLADPTLAPSARRRAIGNLASELHDGEMQDAIGGGAFAAQTKTNQRFKLLDPASRAAAQKTAAEVEKDSLDRRGGVLAQTHENQLDRVGNAIRQQGGSNFEAETMTKIAKYFNFINGGTVGGMDMSNSTDSKHPVVKALEDQTETLQKQTEEQISLQRTRRDTTLSNSNEGQR